MTDSNEAQNQTQTAQREESPARLKRPLIRLAKACGVSTSYIDQLGAYVEIRDEVLVAVLASLGVDASNPAAISKSLLETECRQREQLVPPTVLAITGRANNVPLRCSADALVALTLALEDGTAYAGDLRANLRVHKDADFGEQLELTLPDDLPIGYHTLNVQVGGVQRRATVIVAPPRIELPEAVRQRQRWGWMTQMYSVRSADSWGVGDYGDLKRLAADAGEKSHADFMLINPIHAGAPVPPLQPSPYLPESRRFLNVTYIRPQDIPEYAALDDATRAQVEELHASVAAANDSAEPMDINASWDAKRQALWLIFSAPRSEERETAFAEFKRAAGPDLDAFATWCLAFEVWGAPWEENSWFFRTDKNSPAVAALVRDHHDMFEFQRWLQWIADEQVAAAQQAAKDAGMALGLMQDMAVGVHALGADVWWSPERFADGVTVGAPPDFYNQLGQDWGQPPFSPQYLESTGYRVYREMVHNMFAHAGALRIDHVLGLFRLWWIPRGCTARDGAYVTYNHEVMLSILAIEASRANGVVIGEDLGTVPEYVSKVLAEHGVLGTAVEWFSRVDNSPNAGDPYAPPEDYRKYALASVTTHDLPPTAGYLKLEHVDLREELNLLNEPAEQFRAEVQAEIDQMLALLVSRGYLPQEVADGLKAACAPDADDAETADREALIQRVVEAMHVMLRDSPSVLVQAALVDGVGEHRTQNQPGTSWEYPNWRIPLADETGRVVHTEEVFDLPRVQSLAAALNR
ncbi:4-alpha-glucanotransferase [Bifidobacterium pullorum subsp. gallinarum]|uniref:4-alpha-glucanotransferase n=1 Tax=Bifidobacterium pullorum subsp. gallinarum TaxID=78344 RepID=A0A4P6DQ48_9BIFI|nr:4-alpha-glucanotransferase [Bifidobacterium pullorum]QAY32003.1 4-alpha-glucanotransferase [Bifidobacterium pullorum subsp. gallinarum]